MKKTIITFLFTSFLLAALGQPDPLDQYIEIGLKNNLALRQEQFQLEQAYAALIESKGLFYPSVTFQSDYMYASGGRQIDLPLGDLLNPVYGTLNQLTNSQKFPVLQNQKILFNPNDYQDTRLVATLPLVNAELYYNRSIKKEAISRQQAEILVYKRALIRNIKIAWYQVVGAQKEISIYQNAGRLLDENYKATNSLIRNGKALKGNAFRIVAEINNNQAELAAAANRKKTAVAYFNFLLNRPLFDPVGDYVSRREPPGQSGATTIDTFRVERREELQALKSAIRQSSLNVELKKAAHLPTLATWIDLGYQGYGFKFNDDTRYVFGGISLKWNLFNGGQDRSRVRQAKTGLLELQTKYEETEKQFQLQLIQAQNELSSARTRLASAMANVDNYEEYYRETRARYDQGLVLIVELSDAFTQLINGRVAAELSATNVQMKLAELERAAASYSL